jgi:hypothetical protein
MLAELANIRSSTLDAHIIQADVAEPLTGKWNRSGSPPNNEVRRAETPPSSYFTAQKSYFRQSTANGLQTRYLMGRRHDRQLLDSPNCWPRMAEEQS